MDDRESGLDIDNSDRVVPVSGARTGTFDRGYSAKEKHLEMLRAVLPDVTSEHMPTLHRAERRTSKLDLGRIDCRW